MQSIRVVKAPGKNAPYYPGDYNIAINAAQNTLNLNEPIVTIWSGGVIQYNQLMSSNCAASTDTYWHAGSFHQNGSSTTFVPQDSCDSVAP
jgi:hypothetical protein